MRFLAALRRGRFPGFGSGGLRRIPHVHVERLERDDVMIVVQLPRFGAEAKVGHRWERDGTRLEARGPFVQVLVLEFYFQRLFCVVGESDFGRDRCSSETSCLE